MFVNVSPSSYNRDETTMSLTYAARVKLITNDPYKNVESKETSRMREELMRVIIERDKYKQALGNSGLAPIRISELLAMPLAEALPSSFDESKYDGEPPRETPEP